MATSAQGSEESVQRGGTVLRVLVSLCPVLQGPTLTGGYAAVYRRQEFTAFVYYVCVCVVAVFICQTSLAVVHVQWATSVPLQVSLIHLDSVRLGSTVQGEIQQLQVKP